MFIKIEKVIPCNVPFKPFIKVLKFKNLLRDFIKGFQLETNY